LKRAAFSEASEVYQNNGIPTRALGMNPNAPAIISMSLTGVSLGGALASGARLRFARQDKPIMNELNDVLALPGLNDVLALKT
jgi:hypothetical protein